MSMTNSEREKILRKRAVALKYNIDDVAPKVIGKGQGFVAEKIMEQAKLSQIPIYKDKQLVTDLMGINLGENIPPELYEVVASVLVFISDLDKMEEYRRGEEKQ